MTLSNKQRTVKPKVKASQPKHDTVCIAFIHPGQTSAYFTTSLLAMMLYDGHTNRHITGLLNEWSSANVSASRNSLTANFLDEKDADWLLFIDADMGWDHTALEELLASADPETAPIVGGLCFGANHDELFTTIYKIVAVGDDLTTMRLPDYPDDTLLPCDATGAAFLLIHRGVLAAMRERGFNKAFPWFQETEVAGKPCGEDITFCLRAGILGYPIHVNTGVKIGHHKSRVLTADGFRLQQSLQKAAKTSMEESA